MRDLERGATLPAASLEIGDGAVQVPYPVDEDRPFSLQVVGEEDERRRIRQPERRDPGSHPFDGEHHLGAEDVVEVRKVAGHVLAGGVQKVELFEQIPRLGSLLDDLLEHRRVVLLPRAVLLGVIEPRLHRLDDPKLDAGIGGGLQHQTGVLARQ